MKKLIILVVLFILTMMYYFVPFEVEFEYKTFLTISTFLFAIFTGFFISRQGTRYSTIRTHIANFDGEMSFIYRTSANISAKMQKKVSDILKKHYSKEIKSQTWDYHFRHKSNTITKLNEALKSETKTIEEHSFKRTMAGRLMSSFQNLQKERKNLVALYQERIPFFQWSLLYFLAIILLLTVSFIPSYYTFLAATLKAAFSSAIIFVLFLLHELDQLHFFENTIGEHSARDVLDIIAGKK